MVRPVLTSVLVVTKERTAAMPGGEDLLQTDGRLAILALPLTQAASSLIPKE